MIEGPCDVEKTLKRERRGGGETSIAMYTCKKKNWRGEVTIKSERNFQERTGGRGCFAEMWRGR